MDIEDKRSLLELCYDSLVDIRDIEDNHFIAKLDNKYGIIDIDNNIVYDFQEIEIVRLGVFVLLKGRHMYRMLDTERYKLPDFLHVESCGKAIIVALNSTEYGILGANGEYLMAPIYSNIKVNKRKLNTIEVWAVYKGNPFITEVSINGDSVTKLDVVKTADSRVNFVATGFKTNHSLFNSLSIYNKYKLTYELQNNYSIVTNGKYDSLMFMSNYISFELVHTWKDGYAGIIKTNGDVVIPANKFHKVDGIGYNGIYLVGISTGAMTLDSLRWGVYKEGKGLIVDTIFSKILVKNDVPIVYLYREVNNTGEWFILGNDGKVYREAIHTFPLFKLNVSGVVAYRAFIYGNYYTINANFEPLDGINYAEEYWVRIN